MESKEWNFEEMLREAKERVRDQGGELVSRQVIAVLKVSAEQLQALWLEVNRLQDEIDLLRRDRA